MGMMGAMMGEGIRGPEIHQALMTLMIIMIDTDGDGALSLAEVQAVHERIFNHMDGDDDGLLTADELTGFWHGGQR